MSFKAWIKQLLCRHKHDADRLHRTLKQCADVMGRVVSNGGVWMVGDLHNMTVAHAEAVRILKELSK